MKVNKELLGTLALAAAAVLIAACADAATPTPDRGEPTATPDFQATVDARQSREFATPTPTEVPADEQQVVLDFARTHEQIDRDWEKFHTDFDSWREGLVACDASAMQITLRTFASSFSSIVVGASRLPRSPSVRELADTLLDAAETEGSVLRQLRDQWEPGDPTVFENVDIARSSALAAQKSVQDQLSDLEEKAEPSSLLSVRGYLDELQRLNSTWDAFHRSYDDLGAREADLSSLETVDLLSQLIVQVRDIVAAVRDLPTNEATRRVSDILAGAAQDEDLALRQLRGTFEKSVAEDDGVTFRPLDPTLFDAFDAQLVTTNALRRQADQELADVLAGVSEETSEESKTQATEFMTQFNQLLQAWDKFHQDYDDWRKSEGGCARSVAITTLGGFTLQFADIAGRVSDLPRATFLRPLGELLVEAAEREERALRTLRNTWRPFDNDIYRTFDLERNNANRLRRQVGTGLQDLLARYKISSGDLEQ